MALGDVALKSAGVSVALLPGVGLILNAIGSPPGMSGLFGGIAVTFGAITILIVRNYRGSIRRLALRRLTRRVASAVAIGMLSVGAYSAVYGYCVYPNEDEGVVYYPLVVTGAVADRVAKAGNRVEAIHYNGAARINDLIAAENSLALTLTSSLLAALFGIIPSAFSIALLVPAVRLEQN